MYALDDAQIIKAGDRVSIQIVKDQRDPSILDVSESGEITPPYLKLLPAAGLTCRTLAFNIRRQLERNYLGGMQIVLVKFASIMDVLDDRRLINPGDNLSIRILEDRRDLDERKVTDAGMIEVRYVGTVKAGGMTCRKLAKFISQKLVAMPASSLPFTYSSEAPAPRVVVTIEDHRTHCYPPSMDELDNTTRLKPGAMVGILILEDSLQEKHQIVGEGGEFQPPHIAELRATGLTCRELAFKIKTELEKSAYKSATVIVRSYGSPLVQRPVDVEFVSVFGTVAKEGKYLLPSDKDTTVTDVIRQAGGINPTNSKPRIWIMRPTPQGKKSILVPARAVLVEKRREYDLFLRAGDCVLVK